MQPLKTFHMNKGEENDVVESTILDVLNAGLDVLLADVTQNLQLASSDEYGEYEVLTYRSQQLSNLLTRKNKEVVLSESALREAELEAEKRRETMARILEKLEIVSGILAAIPDDRIAKTLTGASRIGIKAVEVIGRLWSEKDKVRHELELKELKGQLGLLRTRLIAVEKSLADIDRQASQHNMKNAYQSAQLLTELKVQPTWTPRERKEWVEKLVFAYCKKEAISADQSCHLQDILVKMLGDKFSVVRYTVQSKLGSFLLCLQRQWDAAIVSQRERVCSRECEVLLATNVRADVQQRIEFQEAALSAAKRERDDLLALIEGYLDELLQRPRESSGDLNNARSSNADERKLKRNNYLVNLELLERKHSTIDFLQQRIDELKPQLEAADLVLEEADLALFLAKESLGNMLKSKCCKSSAFDRMVNDPYVGWELIEGIDHSPRSSSDISDSDVDLTRPQRFLEEIVTEEGELIKHCAWFLQLEKSDISREISQNSKPFSSQPPISSSNGLPMPSAALINTTAADSPDPSAAARRLATSDVASGTHSSMTAPSSLRPSSETNVVSDIGIAQSLHQWMLNRRNLVVHKILTGNSLETMEQNDWKRWSLLSKLRESQDRLVKVSAHLGLASASSATETDELSTRPRSSSIVSVVSDWTVSSESTSHRRKRDSREEEYRLCGEVVAGLVVEYEQAVEVVMDEFWIETKGMVPTLQQVEAEDEEAIRHLRPVLLWVNQSIRWQLNTIRWRVALECINEAIANNTKIDRGRWEAAVDQCIAVADRDYHRNHGLNDLWEADMAVAHCWLRFKDHWLGFADPTISVEEMQATANEIEASFTSLRQQHCSNADMFKEKVMTAALNLARDVAGDEMKEETIRQVWSDRLHLNKQMLRRVSKSSQEARMLVAELNAGETFIRELERLQNIQAIWKEILSRLRVVSLENLMNVARMYHHGYERGWREEVTDEEKLRFQRFVLQRNKEFRWKEMEEPENKLREIEQAINSQRHKQKGILSSIGVRKSTGDKTKQLLQRIRNKEAVVVKLERIALCLKIGEFDKLESKIGLLLRDRGAQQVVVRSDIAGQSRPAVYRWMKTCLATSISDADLCRRFVGTIRRTVQFGIDEDLCDVIEADLILELSRCREALVVALQDVDIVKSIGFTIFCKRISSLLPVFDKVLRDASALEDGYYLGEALKAAAEWFPIVDKEKRLVWWRIVDMALASHKNFDRHSHELANFMLVVASLLDKDEDIWKACLRQCSRAIRQWMDAIIQQETSTSSIRRAHVNMLAGALQGRRVDASVDMESAFSLWFRQLECWLSVLNQLFAHGSEEQVVYLMERFVNAELLNAICSPIADGNSMGNSGSLRQRQQQHCSLALLTVLISGTKSILLLRHVWAALHEATFDGAGSNWTVVIELISGPDEPLAAIASIFACTLVLNYFMATNQAAASFLSEHVTRLSYESLSRLILSISDASYVSSIVHVFCFACYDMFRIVYDAAIPVLRDILLVMLRSDAQAVREVSSFILVTALDEPDDPLKKKCCVIFADESIQREFGAVVVGFVTAEMSRLMQANEEDDRSFDQTWLSFIGHAIRYADDYPIFSTIIAEHIIEGLYLQSLLELSTHPGFEHWGEKWFDVAAGRRAALAVYSLNELLRVNMYEDHCRECLWNRLCEQSAMLRHVLWGMMCWPAGDLAWMSVWTVVVLTLEPRFPIRKQGRVIPKVKRHNDLKRYREMVQHSLKDSADFLLKSIPSQPLVLQYLDIVWDICGCQWSEIAEIGCASLASFFRGELNLPEGPNWIDQRFVLAAAQTAELSKHAWLRYAAVDIILRNSEMYAAVADRAWECLITTLLPSMISPDEADSFNSHLVLLTLAMPTQKAFCRLLGLIGQVDASHSLDTIQSLLDAIRDPAQCALCTALSIVWSLTHKKESSEQLFIFVIETLKGCRGGASLRAVQRLTESTLSILTTCHLPSSQQLDLVGLLALIALLSEMDRAGKKRILSLLLSNSDMRWTARLCGCIIMVMELRDATLVYAELVVYLFDGPEEVLGAVVWLLLFVEDTVCLAQCWCVTMQQIVDYRARGQHFAAQWLGDILLMISIKARLLSNRHVSTSLDHRIAQSMETVIERSPTLRFHSLVALQCVLNILYAMTFQTYSIVFPNPSPQQLEDPPSVWIEDVKLLSNNVAVYYLTNDTIGICHRDRYGAAFSPDRQQIYFFSTPANALVVVHQVPSTAREGVLSAELEGLVLQLQEVIDEVEEVATTKAEESASPSGQAVMVEMVIDGRGSEEGWLLTDGSLHWFFEDKSELVISPYHVHVVYISHGRRELIAWTDVLYCTSISKEKLQSIGAVVQSLSEKIAHARLMLDS